MKVTNNIPNCSPVVSELLNRAVQFGAMRNPAMAHRINRLSVRGANSRGDREGEAIRDCAAESVIRGTLSSAAAFVAPLEMARLFRERNRYSAQNFLYEISWDSPESWNAVKASLIRSCTSLILSGSLGAASMFDACHTVLDSHRTIYRKRELSALLDAAETALALPVQVTRECNK